MGCDALTGPSGPDRSHGRRLGSHRRRVRRDKDDPGEVCRKCPEITKKRYSRKIWRDTLHLQAGARWDE